MTGLEIDNFLYFTNKHHADEYKFSEIIPKFFPYEIRLRYRGRKESLVEMVYDVDITGNRKQQIANFVLYEYQNYTFYFPATSSRGKLTIGDVQPTSFLLNENIIRKNKSATVLFFQDLRAAVMFQKKLQKDYEDSTHVVATGCLGLELGMMPFEALQYCDVIFIPAPNKLHMSRIRGYYDYIKDYARSFNLYNGFITHSAPTVELRSCNLDISESESAILRITTYLEDNIDIKCLTDCIINNKFNYEEFINWGKSLYIFHSEKTEVEHKNQPIEKKFVFHSSNISSQKNDDSKYISFDDVFPQDGNVLIHGLKDAGKSMVALTAMNSAMEGNNFIFIRNDIKRKVYYIDSEMLDKDLNTRKSQFSLDEKMTEKTLTLFRVKEQEHNVDINDVEFQNLTMEYLEEFGSNYIVFDNITSLNSGGEMYNPVTMKSFYSFIEKLQKKKICSIIVSHTQDNSKSNSMNATARGSQESSIRTHTELVIIGRDHIKGKKIKTPAKVLEIAESQEGATIGILFKVCKGVPALKGKTFWLHLPLGCPTWRLITATDTAGNEMSSDDMVYASGVIDNFTNTLKSKKDLKIHDIENEISMSNTKYDGFDAATDDNDDNISSKIETMILNAAKAAIENNCNNPNVTVLLDKEKDLSTKRLCDYSKILHAVIYNGSIANRQVCEIIGCKDSLATALCKSLCDMKLLTKDGLGQASKYILMQY